MYKYIITVITLYVSFFKAEGRDKVLLVSMDGFRHDYLTKTDTPNFDMFLQEGVHVPYMNNTFVRIPFLVIIPSQQLQQWQRYCYNQNLIVCLPSGLYSEVHGIVTNKMYDPKFDSYFKPGNVESQWWEGGEPIWTTSKKAGLKTGTFFWPGSDVSIHGVRSDKWLPYNKSIPFIQRVETVVGWLAEDGFDFVSLYFNEPDKSGHTYGPDDPQMETIIKFMDTILGHLMDKLDKAGLTDKVNVIVTSDHGMTSVDVENKLIDLMDYVDSNLLLQVVDQGTTAQLRPQPGKTSELVQALTGVEHMKVMLKQDIPEHYHLRDNIRVMPVFAMADEGWMITNNRTTTRQKGKKGDHGYDNQLLSMKPIFMAKGPAFKINITVDPIKSVDVYPLICHLLDIKPSPNNGSLERSSLMLRYYSPNFAPEFAASSLILFTAFVLFTDSAL